MLEQGDAARAAEYLEKAHGESPDDEAVLAALGAAYERLERAAEIEPLLARTLPGLPPIEDDLEARRTRGELWERLGRLRTGADPTGAIVALEQAIEVDPDRTSAREALALLYDGRGEHAEAALRNYRALVAADVTRTASLRALADAYARQGRVDAARCCLEALELFEPATDGDRAFLESHPVPERKPEDPYATTIDEAERARSLVHPEAQVMAEVFAAIWEGIPGLAGATLEALGVGAQEKVSPLSDLTVGKIYGQVAKALGSKRTSLYVGTEPGGREVVLTIPPPPAIVLGRALAEEASPAELRFRLGRALELTRPELILAAAMPPKEFAHLFASVLKAFHPRHSRWRAAAGDAAIEQAAKLKKTLPYKVAKRLAELFQENDATPFSSARWRAVVHQTGNRAGLLVCGDLRVATQIVLAESEAAGGGAEAGPAQLKDAARKPGPLRDLLRYALSEEYFGLRESLGTSVRRAAAA